MNLTSRFNPHHPLLLAVLLATAQIAPADDGKTALGSGIGAAAGTAIGQSVSGKNGAIVGAAVGGAVGAAATTKGSGAVVGGALGGAAGAAVGQSAGGKNGAIIGAGVGGAAGAVIGKSATETTPAPVAAARPTNRNELRGGETAYRDDGRHGKHHKRSKHCNDAHPGRGHAYGKYKNC